MKLVNPENNYRVEKRVQHQARLDLVVPFTTPQLTQAALNAANRLGAGLNAEIRLLKVQVVPFPLDLTHSPVPVDFSEQQLRGFGRKCRRTESPSGARSRAGVACRRWLKRNSLVILASQSAPGRRAPSVWHPETAQAGLYGRNGFGKGKQCLT
jgi:hypothetical protein